MKNNLVPVFDNIILRTTMMLIGMFILGVISYIYLEVRFGAGPRDGLMIVVTKKTGKSVRTIRTFIEVVALIIGLILGGSVGAGTIIMAVLVGFFIQFVFKIFNFDVKKIQHRLIC